jgi:hypothetical protein
MLFGDTVNTASRMESAGVAGGVQLSAAAFAQLRVRPDALAPLEVDIKGKGLMSVFRVQAGSAQAAALRELVDAPWPDGGLPHSPPGAARRDAPPAEHEGSSAAEYTL